MTAKAGYLWILSAAWMVGPLQSAPPVMNGVNERMQGFVEAREIAGAVTLVGDKDTILHLSATGHADIDARRPMTTDALFWIASMTKPITATAVMMMQDAGKLSVDDPVSKYLPEFSGDKAGITIKQCLIHSSGLSDLTVDEVRGITTLNQLVPLFTAKPLQFPPGTKWQYCQTGINAAGRVVEVVSGKSFQDFLQSELFDPLGMKDTGFYPDQEKSRRLAESYNRNDDGRLVKTELRFLGGMAPFSKDRYPLANGGLFSTAEDYFQFARMILNEGELDGKRYLKAESVRLMTSVQSGDLATGFTPGNAWGLGWCVVREPQGVSAALSPGSFGHGGAYGTQAWIDPVKNRVYLLMVQRANFSNSDASEVRREFQNTAVAK